MDKKVLISKLQDKQNGSYFNIKWESEVPVSKRLKGCDIKKVTLATVRKGIQYKNTLNFKCKTEEKARSLGVKDESYNSFKLEQENNLSLPWGRYVKGFENLLIEHTNKDGEYNLYLRLYTSPNKAKTVYLLNGKPISKEELMTAHIVIDSYWKKQKLDGVFNVNIKNIKEVY